jgi:hypothetical protein
MNESAFPWQIDNGETMRGHKGMTLRDYFAAKAMQSIVSKYDMASVFEDCKTKEPNGMLILLAKDAYKLADAMLEAREA